MNPVETSQTLFLVGSSVLFGDDIFGITSKLISFHVSSVPDEVLEEFVAVLLAYDDASRLDDIFDILDKFAAFGAESVLVDRGIIEDIFQRVVDLIVVR